MKRLILCAVVVGMLVGPADAAIITHDGITITMDFATVGDAGNTADVQSQGPFGAVDYVYRIGTYEVTENQWDTVSGITGDLLDDPGSWSGDQPVAKISWHEAAMFCNWLTSGDVTYGAYSINSSGVVTRIDRADAVSSYGTVYVIPTENEWYKAAYYDGGTSTYYNYPTGSDSAPDGIDYDGDATFDAVFSDGHDQGHPNDVDIAGVLSPYGTMGQGGNVWEWNETAIGVESTRGLRGGGWGGGYGLLRASNGYGLASVTEFPDIGFRVASVSAPVPEPSSFAVWSLIGLSLAGAGWRRRRARA